MQAAMQAEKQHTGAMLALYPDTPPQFSLADADLEPTAPDELHVTMAYLGNAADLDEEDRGFLRRLCAQIASEFNPIQAALGGIGRFLNVEDDDTQAYYASVDSPDLEKLRARLVEVLGVLGMIPESAHGFTPHMTLAYVPVGKPAAGAGLQEEPVEFGKLSLSLGGEREDFSFSREGAKQNILLTYPDESKTHRFVWQQHFRGKSAHGDFRVESGDYLVGWTIPDQIPGAIAEPVETLAQATTAVNNPDLWKMDLATGQIKPREIRSGVVRKGDLRALPKGVEIPADWLNEQGVTDKPDPGEAIPVGATRNFPGVFKIVDKGTVEHGAKKPWLAEYWIHGDKWGTQRWLFRLLERNKDNGLQTEGNEEEAEEVKQDTLPPGVIESQPRGATFWVFMQPTDQTPYVLGKEAIDKDWLPPKGVSALPKVIRDRVPKELRYWEVSGQEALDRRAKLAEMDVRELGGSSAKQLGPWQPYRLQYRYFRGPIQVRFGASTKFHDIWLADGTHYVIDGDPLTNDRLAAYQEHDKPTVSTADGERVSVLRIGSEPIELAPGQPANPTKDTPAFVQTVDEGEARVLDSQPEFTKLEFKGGKLIGAWYFRLESADGKIGEFGKSEGPQTSAKYSPGQARDAGGRWTSFGGSIGGAGVSETQVKRAQAAMDDLPEWSRGSIKKVDMRPERGAAFKAGGQRFETGAEWNRRKKTVTIFNANNVSEKSLKGHLSHEAGHSAYDDLVDGSRSGSEAHQQAFGNFRKAWESEDGITNYSKAWSKSGDPSETFAEMAKIHLSQGLGELESVCYRGKATNLLKAYKQSVAALKAGKKSLDEDEKAAPRKVRKFFDDDWNEVKPEQATQAVELEFGNDGQVLSSVTYALERVGAKYSPGQSRDEHGQWTSGGASPAGSFHGKDYYSLKSGEHLPDSVVNSPATVALLPDGKLVVVTGGGASHSELAAKLGESESFDRHIRGEVAKLPSGLSLRVVSDYSGVGSRLAESGDREKIAQAAERNLGKLARRMADAGYPDNLAVRWYQSEGGTAVKTTLAAMKWYKGEKGVRPLFGSPGGKRLLAKTIVDLIPEHKVYVEPFAGGAAVLFAKPPEMSEKEVLADADPDIAFAYRTVKGLTDAEIERLNGMEWRIGKFDEVKDSRPEGELGKLHRWLYLRKMSQGKSGEHQDSGETQRSGSGYTGSKAERLPLVRDRLASAQVRHADYKTSLKEWDGKETFFYLDPPYPESNLGAAKTELRWSDEDCSAFAKALKSLKGKWLVSLQDNQTNRDLFKGYSIRTVTVPTVFNTGGGKGNDRRELLIANYPLPKRVRRKSMDDVEALQLVYTCMGCKGEFESEVVLDEPVCPDCSAKALPWQSYLLQRHNDHHDLRIGDDFTLRLSGSLLDNEPDKAEVSTESPALQGADGQAVDALKVKPGDPVKLSDGEIKTLDKGQARYAKVQQGHQVEFKGGKLEGVYLFGPEGAHPIDDLEHIDVEWEPGEPEPAEPAEPEGDGHPPLFPFEPPHPIDPGLIHPLNPPPLIPQPALPPPGMWYMGNGEVAMGWKIAPPSTAEKDVVQSEQEGEKVGKRIKTEKLSKLQELRQSLESAVKWLGEVIGWASYEDAPTPSMLDFFKGSDAGFTVKTVQGEPWLFTWSANAFKDREGEIFSTKALENWADAATARQDKGSFNFWHIPGSDFATKRWVGVPGRILVEAGPFTNDAKGQAAQKFFAAFPDRHPTLAPEGWGCSVEYRYLPEERKKGVYQNVEITRTSVLPRFAAANTWTAVKEVTMALTDAQKKAAQELFGEDLAASILGEAEAKTKELEPNVAHKGDGEQTEPEVPAVPPEAEQVAPVESEDDKAKKKPKDGEGYPMPTEGEPYPKPTKAEKKSLDQFVKAIRGIAESVTDDSAGRTALMEVADNLSEENLKDMAAKLKKAGKAVGRPDQKSRLAALVEALAGDGVYPAPAKKEFDPDAPEFITSVAAEISKQFKLDTQPIGEALTATASALKGLEDRIAALETQSGRKAATDLPRFVFGLVEQASKADSTIVPEGDKLLDQKPKEAQAAADGSIAAHFFTKPK